MQAAYQLRRGSDVSSRRRRMPFQWGSPFHWVSAATPAVLASRQRCQSRIGRVFGTHATAEKSGSSSVEGAAVPTPCPLHG
jgi:hypothetical protein